MLEGVETDPQQKLLSVLMIALFTLVSLVFLFFQSYLHFDVPQEWQTNLALWCSPELVIQGWYQAFAKSTSCFSVLAGYLAIYFLLRGKYDELKFYWREGKKFSLNLQTICVSVLLIAVVPISNLVLYVPISNKDYVLYVLFKKLFPNLIYGFLTFGVVPKLVILMEKHSLLGSKRKN